MKQYPSIPHWNQGIWGEPVFAFNKYDGSNIRFEWNKKRGWYKFGTRKVLLDPNSRPLGAAVGLFMDKYAEDLERKFTDDKEMRKQQRFLAFCEFIGENSFAGIHNDEDKHDVILFDVNQHNKGLLPPKEFLKKFGDLHIAEVVYNGNYNKEFVNKIKTNTLEGYDLHEGVVCKGSRTTKRKNQELVWMCKVKTNEWIRKVRERLGEQTLLNEFNGKRELFEEKELV